MANYPQNKYLSVAEYRTKARQAALPSNNKPKSKRKIPPGAIDVWRVSSLNPIGDRVTWVEKGLYSDEDLAYQAADKLHLSTRYTVKINVEHKAAIMIDGKLYLIYLNPIKLQLPVPKDVVDEIDGNKTIAEQPAPY